MPTERVEIQRDGQMQMNEPGSHGFTGTINLGLSELIQMICLSRADLVIRVKSANERGEIYIKSGQIHHAHTKGHQGEPAFFEILQWPEGRFEMSPFLESVNGSLEKPWEHLLLEAMRRQDEVRVDPITKSDDNYNHREEETFYASMSEEMRDEIDIILSEIELIGPSDPEPQAKEKEVPQEHAIKVLIVEDSAFFARQMKGMLEEDPEIQVVAIAQNGKEALDLLSSNSKIDLITLDVQMPVMQGDTALKHIMIRHPIPVVMTSSFQAGSLHEIFEFLQAGAVDFVSKPAVGEDIAAYAQEFRKKVKSAATAKVSHFRRCRKPKSAPFPAAKSPQRASNSMLVLVGAEGAYMDWFRLPLARLCAEGLLVGFQKLPSNYLEEFCKLIAAWTGARTEVLEKCEACIPGSFFLGNGDGKPQIVLDAQTMTLGLKPETASPSGSPAMVEGWLRELISKARERISICFLSGAPFLSQDLIEFFSESGAKLILPPRESVLCPGIIDQIHIFSQLYPLRITTAMPENLLEAWLK